MSYYFNKIKKRDLEIGCSQKTAIKHLKKRCQDHLKPVIKKITNELNIHVEVFWISKSTFGAVLCDFTPIRTGPSIIGPHTPLFNLVSGNINYIIISQSIGRNYNYKYLSTGEKVLIINILRFKKFIKTLSDKDKRVKLLLVKDLTPEEEDIINDWVDFKSTQKEKKKYISTDEFIEGFPKKDPRKASQITAGVLNAYQNNLFSNVSYFEEQLEIFEQKVNDPKTSENELRDELKRNIWIIDFKYQDISQFNHEKELEVKFEGKKGYIDLWVSRVKTQMGKDIFIELKLPSSKNIVQQRKRDSIGSQVGRAISQLINYLESKKEGNRIQTGLVIIGRENKNFIELFNQYLHNIQIKTYAELITECRSIINIFKGVCLE